MTKIGWDLLWEKKGEDVKDFDPAKLVGWYDTNFDFKIQNVINQIKSKLELKKSDDLLDVGCGAGALLIPLSKYVKSVSGVDLSTSLIKLLKKHSDAGLFVSGANKLPFEKNIFDKILIQDVIHYFPSLDYAKQSILECIRICRPGGRILIGDIPDLEKKKEELIYRARTFPERKSSNLHHLFYSKDFFIKICEDNNLKYEIWDLRLTTPFRFNVLIKVGETEGFQFK